MSSRKALDPRVTILIPADVEETLAALMTEEARGLNFPERQRAAGDVVAALIRQEFTGRQFEAKAGLPRRKMPKSPPPPPPDDE